MKITALTAAAIAVAAAAPFATAVATPKNPTAGAASALARAVAGRTPNTATFVRAGTRVRVVRTGRRVSSALLDRNRDGRFDAGAIDLDRDGRLDFAWLDRDRDGRPQPKELRRLHRAPLVLRTGACALARGTCANLDVVVDTDGDREDETVKGDPGLYSGGSYGRHTDGDADADEIVVGTKGGATVSGTGNLDNDPRDTEVIVEDPTLPAGQFHAVDIDRDGDADVIVVGTGTGVANPPAKPAGTGNVDNDPADTEVVVEDPSLPVGQTITVDIDRDGDPDVIYVGTRGGATTSGVEDLDGDGEGEIIGEDPGLPTGQTVIVDVDRDGDADIVIYGTRR